MPNLKSKDNNLIILNQRLQSQQQQKSLNQKNYNSIVIKDKLKEEEEEEDMYRPSIRIAPIPTKSKLICRVIVDFLVIISLFIPILLLYFNGKPYKRGFYCNDDSIRYPYLDSTISSNLLFTYSIAIPIWVICINELLIYRFKMTGYNSTTSFLIKNYCWQVYIQLIPFAFACFSSQLITDIAKYSIGRLRPHFIDICQPKINNKILNRLSICSEPEFPSEAYITDFVCSKNVSESKIKDSRLSFMSGHSSFCAVTLMYLVFYIQLRVHWRSLGLIRPLIQYLLICLILFTGFSRISDYKHHWSDVLVGLIQGTIVAAICVFCISDLYKPRNYLLLTQQQQSQSHQENDDNDLQQQQQPPPSQQTHTTTLPTSPNYSNRGESGV